MSRDRSVHKMDSHIDDTNPKQHLDEVYDTDEQLHRSRSEHLTEKGLDYQTQLHQKNLRTALSAWRRTACEIQLLSADFADIGTLRHLRASLNEQLKPVLTSYERLQVLLSDDNEIHNKIESVEEQHRALMKLLSDKIYEIDSEAGSVASARSRRSNSSNRSGRSSNSVRAEAAAATAAIKARLEYFELEAAKEIELKRIRNKRELCVAEARYSAIVNTEKDPTIDTVISSKGFVGTETPKVTSYVNQTCDTGQLGSQNIGFGGLGDLTKLFAEQINLGRLPPPEPGIFTGDPLRYSAWRQAFEVLVDNKGLPPAERMYFLKKYLGGEAREATEGYFILMSDDAYHQALTLLDKRYGDPFIVASAFRNKIESWPKVGLRDGHGLRKFSDFLKQCLTAMDSIHSLHVLNDDRENRRILSKLPDWFVLRWGRVVSKWKMDSGIFPPFKEFVRFMETESEIACDPVVSLQSLRGGDVAAGSEKSLQNCPRSRQKPSATRSLNTKSKEKVVKPTLKQQCAHCGDTHHIDDCLDFVAKPMSVRKEIIHEKKLCFGCLENGHRAKECRKRRQCAHCMKFHPTSLHWVQDEADTDRKFMDATRATTCATHHMRNLNDEVSNRKCSMILPVWVSSSDNSSVEKLTYALLDTQSDSSFVSDDLCGSLGVDGPGVKLSLSTMTAQDTPVECRKIQGMVVRGFHSSSHGINLPPLYSRKIMPVNRAHIPTPEIARQWPHLQAVADLLTPLQPCDVGLLIGYNCPRALVPRDVVPALSDEGNSPFAQQTDLGWGIVGVTCPEKMEGDNIGVSHRIVTRCVPPELSVAGNMNCDQVVFSNKTTCKEFIKASDVTTMLELDFKEHNSGPITLSWEDRMFLDELGKNIHQDDQGHYEMPLPFRGADPVLQRNEQQACKRLQQLKNRFNKDAAFQQDYVEFMENVIAKGYAERVSESDLQGEDGHVWFIPHHGVYNKKKPGKIRVVFDCSARYDGTSLNQHLLQGPDVTNSLIGILCRFRKKPIAFTCDIEQMFFQFKVSSKHRDYLRFLWWDNCKCEGQPAVYRMCVHIFGAASSPGCATFALRRLAEDYKSTFGADVTTMIHNNFYVDDGLQSLDSAEEAIDLIERTKELCSKGGLRLHKFTSNSPKVIDSIDPSDRTKDMKNMGRLNNVLSVENVLGIQWCIELDTFKFRLTLMDNPLTRRGILSTVSSAYDPLGFIAPVLLEGKQILQEMCREQLGWDSPISDELRPRWERWRNGLFDLEKLDIRRCFMTTDFGDVQSVELHHFSDASTLGYGQCSYIRMIDDHGNIACSLVMGKARVTPLKLVTIPRLELTAALVSVRVSELLQKELDFQNITECFWTDSKIVLGYISNDSRRFHVFVANRVQQIRNHTVPSQWKYVRSEDNPADDASRGLRADEMLNGCRWIDGPSFLWETEVLPFEDDDGQQLLHPEDPELKRQAFTAHCQPSTFELDRLERFSDWHQAKRSFALCVRFKDNLKNRVQQRKDKQFRNSSQQKQSLHECVNVEEERNAEHVIIHHVQLEIFGREIKDLCSLQSGGGAKGQNRISQNSPLYKLDVFLDDKGLLRVGGRLSHAEIPFQVKHPLVLPKQHHITNLVIKFCHEQTQHQGRGMTVNDIRSRGYWIIGCTGVVSRHIYNCVPCRRLRGSVQEQKMADLPEDRMETAPPFTYCAVDYFGPFIIKEGRKELKRYGALFTCMASRAIHIEVSSSLSTDSFLNALRRMICIRGPIRQLRCDRGTNFVGAEIELAKALEEMDHESVCKRTEAMGCDYITFKKNPPYSSHQGGVWERQIRSVRNVLATLMFQSSRQLNEEALRTVMAEAMAIVNSRPLDVDHLNDPLSAVPICPNQLLTMKSRLILPPPGHFCKEDMYCRKWWRRVQHISNEFWTQWRKQYLQNLQVRSKWQLARRNMKEGDIVLLKDDSAPRSQWPMARVHKTSSGMDGRVRSVILAMGDRNYGDSQKCVTRYLERPVQKLVLLCDD